MEIRTFKEWSEAGYKITKGSKAVSKNSQGESMFTEYQVEKMQKVQWGKPAGQQNHPVVLALQEHLAYPEMQHAEGYGGSTDGDYNDYSY